MDRSVITDLRHAPVDVDIGGGRADGQLLMDTRPNEKPEKPAYIAMKADKEKYLDLLCCALAKG